MFLLVQSLSFGAPERGAPNGRYGAGTCERTEHNFDNFDGREALAGMEDPVTLLKISCPYAQCMVYLPTFGSFMR